MARQPLTLPAALDQYEDAIAGVERRVPKLQRAMAALEEVLKTTPTAEAATFLEDLQSLHDRLAKLKGQF